MPAKNEIRPSPADKRQQIRTELWPEADGKIWNRKLSKGFTTIPRLLPLVMHLISELAKKGNPANVYLELWARSFDEGVMQITDEEAAAYAAGYSGTRAVRTWREHMFELKELGFIDIKASGNREIAYVLLLNPINVCVEYKRRGEKKMPEEWWTAFLARAQEIGAEIPPLVKQSAA